MRGFVAAAMISCAGACGSVPIAPDASTSGPAYAHGVAVKAPIIHDEDEFGYRISVSGDGRIMAVGVPRDDSAVTGVAGIAADRTAPDAGAVYIYALTNIGWVSQVYLKPGAIDAADQFGTSVGLSTLGDTLVVGAPAEDGSATNVDGDGRDNSRAASGAAYVFKRHGAQWEQQAYLKPTNTGVEDAFGTAVSISGDGNTVAVGAPGEDSQAAGVNGNALDNTLTDSGAVYTFSTDGVTWQQEAYLKASNPDKADHFGGEVTLSADGSTLAVGAAGEDGASTGIDGDQTSNAAINAGAVYLFRRIDHRWAQQAYLKGSNTRVGDAFGLRLALSGLGSLLVVGAPYADRVGEGPIMDIGAAYIFGFSEGAWHERAYLTSPAPGVSDQFGQAVTASGDGKVVAVSAPNDDGLAMDTGAVFVFANPDEIGWTLSAQVNELTPTAGDQLGSSLALSSSGAFLSIGVALESMAATKSGAVYVYY